jgi:hypothetical protein
MYRPYHRGMSKPDSRDEMAAGTHAGAAAELSRIEHEFPGWHPWMSSGARWWATRKGGHVADPPEWWATTVDADTADELRESIAKQERPAEQVGAA